MRGGGGGARDTATAAIGAHPTGMHSCFGYFVFFNLSYLYILQIYLPQD